MHRPFAIALAVALAVLAFPTHPAVAAPVNVVATLPVLKEFAEEVGRNHVSVTTLISGFESEHTYSPKPSDLKRLAEARLVLEIGLGLEVWVGNLVKSAGNPDLRIITTSRGVPLIRDDVSDDSSSGNPHIWLDPENAKVMIRHIADGLVAVDPAHKHEYLANLAEYVTRLERVQQDLRSRVAALHDRRIVTHHPAWPYFARRFGFRIEGSIIPLTGAEPSVAHLADLARRIKADKIKVIVTEPQLNQKMASVLAHETGALVVVLSPLPGAIKGTESYLSMLEHHVAQLIAALQSERGPVRP